MPSAVVSWDGEVDRHRMVRLAGGPDAHAVTGAMTRAAAAGAGVAAGAGAAETAAVAGTAGVAGSARTAGAAERIIEHEVRELVRRRGIDPGDGGAATVRTLIDEVIADYAERSLTASMPPLAEPATVAKAVADRVIGLGPLQPYFDDPEVEEIWINQPDKVFVAKAGRPILTSTVLSEEQVHDLVELML